MNGPRLFWLTRIIYYPSWLSLWMQRILDLDNRGDNLGKEDLKYVDCKGFNVSSRDMQLLSWAVVNQH